jgi:hypothetical protein
MRIQLKNIAFPKVHLKFFHKKKWLYGTYGTNGKYGKRKNIISHHSKRKNSPAFQRIKELLRMAANVIYLTIMSK